MTENTDTIVELEDSVFDDVLRIAQLSGQSPVQIIESALRAEYSRTAMDGFHRSLLVHQSAYGEMCR